MVKSLIWNNCVAQLLASSTNKGS